VQAAPGRVTFQPQTFYREEAAQESFRASSGESSSAHDLKSCRPRN